MECSEGRVLSPLDPAQFPFVHTGCIGVVPKGSTGKWWLIVDMSSPSGASINDNISKSVSYVGVDDVAKGIHSFG